MQRMIYGLSSSVEAEYGSRAEERYTIAEAMDDEIYAVRGFRTHKAMIKAAKAEYVGVVHCEYFGK